MQNVKKQNSSMAFNQGHIFLLLYFTPYNMGFCSVFVQSQHFASLNNHLSVSFKKRLNNLASSGVDVSGKWMWNALVQLIRAVCVHMWHWSGSHVEHVRISRVPGLENLKMIWLSSGSVLVLSWV